jgi:hypothetical protein
VLNTMSPCFIHRTSPVPTHPHMWEELVKGLYTNKQRSWRTPSKMIAELLEQGPKSAADPPEAQRVVLPWEATHRHESLAVVLPDLLTPTECEAIIRACERARSRRGNVKCESSSYNSSRRAQSKSPLCPRPCVVYSPLHPRSNDSYGYNSRLSGEIAACAARRMCEKEKKK